MTTTTTVEWVFEGPDPEVGIFGDLILHPCETNVDEEPAEETGCVSVTKGNVVEHLTSFTCVCGARTVTVDQSPIEHFYEPGRDW